ncbi:MAG: SAM-dependent methyltransferase [Acidimicrobiales bacterium]
MTGRSSTPNSRGWELPEIDISVATNARVYDYLLGGETNFAIDREAGERQGAAVGGMDNARAAVRANRVFLGEIVRHLIDQEGIRQFLDIGSGIPTEGNVHEVAQQAAPESRVVYVDNDPVVLAHAHVLLRGTAQGATSYIQADMHDPEDILGQASDTLDFTQPIAVMLLSMLHFIHDEEDAYGVVRRLLAGLPSGSFMVVSHITGDFHPVLMGALADAPGEQAQYTFTVRSRDEIAGFFAGLELVEPGVAPMAEWLPAGTDADLVKWSSMYHCAIGRKP